MRVKNLGGPELLELAGRVPERRQLHREERAQKKKKYAESSGLQVNMHQHKEILNRQRTTRKNQAKNSELGIVHVPTVKLRKRHHEEGIM